MEISLGKLRSVAGEDLPSDDNLVRAAREDPAEIAALYRRYVERVYRYFYSRTGCAADAEDLTSQVFLDALHNLRNYHVGTNFAAWLFTIAHRRLVDAYRAENPTLPLREDEHLDPSDPLNDLIHAEQSERLESLFRKRTLEEQELLRLHYAADLTYGQMAVVLGRNQAAIKMAMSRLIRSMREQWEAEE